MRTIISILFLFTLFSAPISAQSKGDFFICYGFEFPSGGYLSLRYYPVDRIGVEVYSSAFWYIFNYGARLNIHTETVKFPHTFISIGYSNISAYNPYAVHDTSESTMLFIRRFVKGIDLGVGREVIFDNKRFSFQAGPTYVVNMEDSFYNEEHKEEFVQTPPLFSYFFVGTLLSSLPEKDPKPIYVK